MKARHYLSRIALVLAVAAVSAPLAQASSPDDWFRDAGAIRHRVASAPGPVAIDDWFRSSGTPRTLAGIATSSVAVDDYFRGAGSTSQVTRQSPAAVDDYFRTPALVSAGGSGFDWGDAGIGAGSGFGLALALAGLGLIVLRRRMGETKTGTAATVPS
jgi:hypothetical protein